MRRKRITAFLLAVVMLFGNTATAFATEGEASATSGATEIQSMDDQKMEDQAQQGTSQDTNEENSGTNTQTLDSNEENSGEDDQTQTEIKSTDDVVPAEEETTVWHTADGEELSPEDSFERLRLLFFASLEDEKELLGEIYQNPIFYESEYVDVFLLDIGGSDAEALLTLRGELRGAVEGLETDRITYCYETDGEFRAARDSYFPDGSEGACYVLLDKNGDVIGQGDSAEGDAQADAEDSGESTEKTIVEECLELVRNHSTSALAAPVELAVTGNYLGEVLLTWRVPDVDSEEGAESAGEDIAGYAIYASDAADGVFRRVGMADTSQEESDTYTWSHVFAVEEGETNPVWYYQLRSFDKYLVEGEAFSEMATNEGLACIDNAGLFMLSSLYSEDGSVNKLLLHVGETVFLQFGLNLQVTTYAGEDAGTEDLTEGVAYEWSVCSGTDIGDLKTVTDYDIIDFWQSSLNATGDIYVQGKAVTGTEENYYLRCQFKQDNSDAEVYYSLNLLIPVEVVENTESVDYPDVGRTLPEDVFTDRTEMNEYILGKLLAREEDFTVYVSAVEESASVAESSSETEVSYTWAWKDDWFLEKDIFDFYTEELNDEPGAGDYLRYSVDASSSYGARTDDAGAAKTVDYKGGAYIPLDFHMEYHDDAEKEEWVAAQVQKLLALGGALYSYRNSSDDVKAQQCLNYIRNNISYTPVSDDSAYGALKNKKAYSKGFAMLYYRLMNEMGVRTRIVLHPDGHYYNLVKIDDEYYCVDVSANKLLYGSNTYSIGRNVEMQNPFINELTIAAGSYTPKYVQLYVEGGEGSELLGRYSSFQEARAKMDGEASYVIQMTGDVSLSGQELDLTDMAYSCKVHLNGHILTAASASTISANLEGGILKAPWNSTLTLKAEDEMSMTDVELQFDTASGSGGLILDGENGGLTMTEITANRVYNVEASGTVGCDADLTIAGSLKINESSAVVFGGNVTVGTISALEGVLDVGSLTVSGNTTVRLGTVLRVHDTLSMANVTVQPADGDAEPVRIQQVCTVDESTGKVTRRGSLKFTGGLYKGSSTMSDSLIRFEQVKNTDYESKVVFQNGDILATVLSYEGYIPTQYFSIDDESVENLSVIREGNSLKAVRGDNVVITYVPDMATKEYSTFTAAMSKLASDFGSKSGEYNFTFNSNAEMTGGVTIPYFVQSLSMKGAAQGTVSLDFAGYTLSTSAAVQLGEGLQLVSSSGTGTLNLTKSAAEKEEDFSLKINAGYVEKVNLTASNGRIVLEGNESDTKEYLILSTVTAKYLLVQSGGWTLSNLTTSYGVSIVKNGSCLKVTGTAAMTGAGFVIEKDAVFKVTEMNIWSAYGMEYAGKYTIENHGSIIAGKWTQNSAGKLFMDENSCMAAEQSANIYYMVLGGDAHFYQMSGCTTSLNGTLTRTEDDAVLSYGVVSALEDSLPMVGDIENVQPRTKLFTSNIGTFPVSLVKVLQRTEDYQKYSFIYQNGQELRVGDEWITVKSVGVDGNEETLKSFMRWSDTQNYLNTLANTSMTYVVEFSEDVIVEENLSLPSRVKSIIFRAAESAENRITFSYVGDLSLATDTTFKNLNLKSTSYNWTTQRYEDYKGTLWLNGRNLTYINTDADYGSVWGSYVSTLELEDSNLTTSGAVSSIGTINLTDSELMATGAVTGISNMSLLNSRLGASAIQVTNTLTMKDARLTSTTWITLGNLITNSEDNHITYGGNASYNMLTITGTVSTDEEVVKAADGTDVDLVLKGSTDTVTVRKTAVDISVTSLESTNGYQEGVLLLTASKATSGWFVVGRGANGTCSHGTYKDGYYIRCSGAGASGMDSYPVRLDVKEKTESYAVAGGYQTLQAAFDEINRIADRTADYRVTINNAEEATSGSANLGVPYYAEDVLIRSSSTTERTALYYAYDLSLSTNARFENIEFVPSYASSSFSLGVYSMELDNCGMAEGKNLTTVAGSGVYGTSALIVINAEEELLVQGNLVNVGSLHLKDSSVTVNGTIQIGDFYTESTEDVLTGYAVVQRDWQGTVVGITPYINIYKQVYASEGGSAGLALREVRNNEWQYVDFDAEEASSIRKTGIRLAYAQNVPSQAVQVSGKNAVSGGYIIKDNAYLLFTDTAPGILLSYEDADKHEVETQVVDFTAASVEINNLRTYREYTVTLCGATEEISRNTAKSLSMPYSGYVSKLTVRGEGENPVKLYYIGDISVSSEWDIGNVYFSRMVWNGREYVPADYPNGESGNREEYPGIMVWYTNGYPMTVSGTVLFNTPVNLYGSWSGSFAIAEDGRFFTETHGYSYNAENENTEEDEENGVENLLCGYLNSFGTVTLKNGQNLRVCEFGSASYKSGGTATVTNLTLNDATLHVDSGATFTNVTLSGHAELFVERDFNIYGTLTSTTQEGYLFTRQRAVDQAPYLYIAGQVLLQDGVPDKVHVGVYPASNAARTDIPVRLRNAPNATGQLLSVGTADADKFLAWEDNVGNVGLYGPGNQDGYILKKTGTAIYVYMADEVVVALCEGDAGNGNLEEASVLNYYVSFQDAVDAINAKYDREKTYTMMLLQDSGSLDNPITLNLPYYARQIIITSQQEEGAQEPKSIYYTNNIYLSADTVFKNVEFAPMNWWKGSAALGFITSIYDLELSQVSKGDMEGMNLSFISGNGYQTTTLDSPDLYFTGDLLYSGDLVVKQSAEVNGSVYATNLDLEGGVNLKVNGTVSVTNIGNHGEEENSLKYGRNAWNYTYLNVSGAISGENTNPLVFDMATGTHAAEEYRLEMNSTGVWTSLSELNKLANLTRIPTDAVSWQFDSQPMADGCRLVKASGGIYLAGETVSSSSVGLEWITDDNESPVHTDCLDFTQAITEINLLADGTRDYTILFDGVTDTCITDGAPYGTLPMPNSYYVKSLTIQPDTVEQASLTFVGGLTYYGNLTLKDICLNPLGSYYAESPTDFNLIVGASGAGASLKLEKVTTKADSQWVKDGTNPGFGFINQVIGTYLQTDVVMKDCNLWVKYGIYSIKDMTLEDTKLLSSGSSTVRNLYLNGLSTWDTLGSTMITNIYNEGQTEGSYLASKLDYWQNPMFAVNGEVSRPVSWKVLTYEALDYNLKYVESYQNVKLVKAVSEAADKFRAEGWTEGDTVAYKDVNGYVYNGDISEMAVRITSVDGTNLTYAQSFNEAVQIINYQNDRNAEYVMELLQTGEVKTAGNGNSYGTMGLPTNAKQVTIRGTEEEGQKTVLAYTGTIWPNCNVRFENLVMTEGYVSGTTFVPSYSVTPEIYTGYKLSFGADVETLRTGTSEDDENLVFSRISGNYGCLSLESTEVLVQGAVSLPKLEVIENVSLEGRQSVSITDMEGSGSLYLKTFFQAYYLPVTQLAIYGDIGQVKLIIAPQFYDSATETWHAMNEEDGEKMNIGAGLSPTYYQRMAVLSKASLCNIQVVGEGDKRLEGYREYKSDGILYLTTQEPIIKLIGHEGSLEGDTVYESEFLNWDQSIQEINRIADRSRAYELILLRDVGISGEGEVAPHGVLSMPYYAEELLVKSKEGTTHQIYFTGTTISLSCSTTFENVGLMAVQGYWNTEGRLKYRSTAYNIYAAGYVLTERQLNTDSTDVEGQSYISMPATIYAPGYGAFQYYASNEKEVPADYISGFQTVAFQMQEECGAEESTLTVKSGIYYPINLELYDGITIECPNADVYVTNMKVTNAKIWAKNIVNYTMTTLDNGYVKAGSDVIGDGTCNLNQITVAGKGNILEAKQDYYGNSLLYVNGRITAGEAVADSSEPISVGLCYNNSKQDYVQLFDGMTLLYAPQAASSWFRPLYAGGVQNGMGEQWSSFGAYKYGRYILYGNQADMEVSLHLADTESFSYFKTFEEAVTEINFLNRYDYTLKKYDDYDIQLLKDVEIGNDSQNGYYSGLPMPSYAGTVTIYSNGAEPYAIRFAGGLSIYCNTVLKNIAVYPMTGVQGKGVPTQADYYLNYSRLTLDNVVTWDEEGNTLVRHVTGSTGSAALCLKGNTELELAGNYSAYNILFDTAEGEKAVLKVMGSIFTYLTEQLGLGEAEIWKPLNSSFTLYGLDLDRDGDGKLERESVIRKESAPKLCIRFMTDSCPEGTNILNCRYIDTDDYVIRDQSGRQYGCYANGSWLVLGDIIADRILKGITPTVKYGLSPSTFVYSGEEIKPAVTLKDMDTDELLSAADAASLTSEDNTETAVFQLTYSNNVNAGTASIKVEPMEGSVYKGDGTIEYRIAQKNLASADVKIAYTGTFIQEPDGDRSVLIPEIQVTDEGRLKNDDVDKQTLAEGVDYQWQVTAEDEEGAYASELLVSGIGNYRGYVYMTLAEQTAEQLCEMNSCSLVASAESDSDSSYIFQVSVDSSLEAYEGRLYLVQMDEKAEKIESFLGAASLSGSEGSSDGESDEAGQTDTQEYFLTVEAPEVETLRSVFMQKVALAVVTEDGFKRVSSNAVYVENVEAIAPTTNTYQGYYEGKTYSKKGMQGTDYAATYDLGVQAALINIPINELVRSSANIRKYTSAAYIPYEYKGETYYFFNMNQYQDTLFYLNGWADGNKENPYGTVMRNVSVDLLLGWDDELTYLIHPSARVRGKSYYTLNMEEEQARKTYEALFCYLGQTLGGEETYTANTNGSGRKYRVSNWVLGNEVNCCTAWNYAGSLSSQACIENYTEAFQLLYQGVKQWDANTRVFISLDHQWTANNNGHSGKSFLTSFAKYMHETAPQMRWNVDYHPYSMPMSRNDYWNDYSYATDNEYTAYITMRNLSVLNSYLEELEELYFPDEYQAWVAGGKVGGKEYIRVILGEQGFSGSGASQAAAIVDSFYIATFNTRVDAMINRAYTDDPADGLSLGVMNVYSQEKESYSAYKYMDKEGWSDYVGKYAATRGISSWTDLHPELANLPKWNEKYEGKQF